MKDLEYTNRRLPYGESDEQVDQLVSAATAHAIEQSHRRATAWHQRHRLVWAAAAMVVILLGVGAALFYAEHKTAVTELDSEAYAGPVDTFLSSLTDDEAMQVAYYEIDEIPEY